WIDGVDYSFDESRKPAFIKAIRRYYPGLDADRLTPGYTGIRPKLSAPAEPAADFLMPGPQVHGVRGLVKLFGIESHGLTASFPLANTGERVRRDSLSSPLAPLRRSSRFRTRPS